MRLELRFRIDLREIGGEGEFICPTCGATISPDDYSGLTYRVLRTKRKENGTVKEVTLRCGGCGSTICLEGFDLLEDIVCSSDRIQAGRLDGIGSNSEKLLNNRPLERQPEGLERPKDMVEAIIEDATR